VSEPGGSYDWYPDVEEEFQALLDVSLDPCGPEVLYDIVEGFGLAPGSTAVDVGCGVGRHACALASRFGFSVAGIDPAERNVAVAIQAAEAGGLDDLVSFEIGTAESLPFAHRCLDLVWCRDVLVHVTELEPVYAEFRRVLKDGGRAVVYQSCFTTERLEPKEAEAIFTGLDVVPASTDHRRHEAAIAGAGLTVDDCVEVGLEWGEESQEQTGTPGRRLLHTARLLRDPLRYVGRFGQPAYDTMLADCLWHVYRLLGKLEGRVYVLSR
jgi:SAM-dependent methyltransferase